MNQLEELIKELAPREDFISAMRTVASSVTVVTTDGPAGRHGATVSAFCSVSADPPSVLVCLNSNSRIARAVAENKVFSVNVLPESQQDIADRFAGRHDNNISDRFDGIDLSGTVSTPLIAGATSFSCELEESITFGSHQIFFGLVTKAQGREIEPLTYLNGAYHCVVPKRYVMEP